MAACTPVVEIVRPLSIDLSTCDNTHATGVVLLIDAGGTNRMCGVDGGAYFGAGFLLDASGNDSYTAHPEGIGSNGGVRSGFLLDVGGDDG